MFSPIFIMWIHLIAAITWIGGMLFLWLVLRPAIRQWPPQSQGLEILRRIEERFRTIRWVSLLTLLATGIFNLIHEGGSARLESNWGGVLMVKLVLVAIVMGLSGINDFLLTSSPRPASSGESGRTKDLLGGLILVLSLFIVFIAVYLGQF
ncbi:MAG: CopD family protein [Nitrospiria bacterium]